MGRGFIELIESGRIADEAALKRAFRAAAKRAHPDARAADAGALGDAARDFVALRADYESALAHLRARATEKRAETGPVEPLVFSRREFYESFEDLLGRGFPRRPRAAYPRAAYEASRSRLLAYLAGRDVMIPEGRSLEAFLALESGYASLVRPDARWMDIENDPGRSLYFFLTNLVLYHETGFAHLAAFSRNVYPTVKKLLAARRETRPLAFLELLFADLVSGPACVT